MEPKKDEVGIRFDDELQKRLAAYAGREGLTIAEAISVQSKPAPISAAIRRKGRSVMPDIGATTTGFLISIRPILSMAQG